MKVLSTDISHKSDAGGAGMTVRQAGLRIVRGLEAEERHNLLACWIELWRGVVHSHRMFMEVGVSETAKGLEWTIKESDRPNQ